MQTFHLPAPSRDAFTVLDPLPGWLRWSRRLIERWGAGTYFTVQPTGLGIHGTLYGRTVPATALAPRGQRARLIDFAVEPAARPVARTNALGLPGYLAGWCRRGDGTKVLAFITDPARVVEVPTQGKYVLLLSVDRPADFAAALDDLPM